jgi:hypothetical protein
VAAAAGIAVALSLFLTPSDAPQTVPQLGRYAVYAAALFLIAIAAGTVVGALVVGTTWAPAIYLWLVPFTILALPAVDPSAAYFVYTGVTSRFAGGLALVACVLWTGGVPIGAVAMVRLARGPGGPQGAARSS